MTYRIIKDTVLTSFLLLFIAIALGMTFFSHSLLVYKRTLQSEITIFSNFQNLSPLFLYTFFSFIGVFGIILFLSLLLRAKKKIGYIESLRDQTATFIPLLLLPFDKFFFGKAVEYFICFPLFPLFTILIVAVVIHLNLILYFDLNLLRSITLFFKKHVRHNRKISAGAISLILLILLIHAQVNGFSFHRFTGIRLFGGDEPKYLRMAYSLATDMDLDVSDEFVIEEGLEQAKKRILSSGSRVFGDLSVIGVDGKIYHIHMPGLSMLFSPLLKLDMLIYPSETAPNNPYPYLKEFPAKLQFTRLGLLLLGILTFLLFARLIYRLFNSLFLLALLLILFIYSSPVPDFIFQLYPEVTACFLTLLVVNALLFPFRNRFLNDLLTVLGIGFLPWLHQRFIFIALGLYITLVINEVFYRKNYKRPLFLSLFLFIASLPYFYYFYAITGNPLPTSIHALYGYSFTRISMFPLGFFGHFFDYSVGMLWYFPWAALALIGIYHGLRLERKRAALILIISVPYFLFTCTHIAWHGMVKQPGRYLVAIFPFLLIFLAYTIKRFSKRPAYFHLFLYIGLLTVTLLNRKIWFLFFSFAGPYVSYSHFIQIIQCFSILAVVCFAVFLSEKFSEKNLGLISRDGLIDRKNRLLSHLHSSSGKKKLKKAVVYLPVGMFLVYASVFLRNWNDKTMSVSFMGAMNKIKSLDEVELIQKTDPQVRFKRKDRDFRELFKNVYTFRLGPSQEDCRIRIENTPFYERIPAGAYVVRLETNNLEDTNIRVVLNCFGERRLLRFSKRQDIAEASITFLLYKDRYASPLLKLEPEVLESEGFDGILEFSPLPYLTYGKSLMLRPVPNIDPKPVRKRGKDKYSLVFLANSSKDKQEPNFLLYTLENSDEMDRNKETLLASVKEDFREEMKPYRVDMGFELSSGFLNEKSGLALFAHDRKGNPMECASLWLNTKKEYWVLLKNPRSNSNRIIFDF